MAMAMAMAMATATAGCRTARQHDDKTTGLERIIRRESDKSRMDVERTKVPTMATLSLAMLQQRWHCSSQRCCCRGMAAVALLLLRHYDAIVATML
ncbi:unnamed protein product [Sphagnum jensenii]|uniref:Secreted protein n=1 Tax=Sphagnum jensenii TaxID=128206 RepID=A0ABP1BG26_9BRYO